nr:immunoglobulin heavy chain junction region [Macaca mulatta]MPN83291.1 immunoglobulin heavy chain junction region [Macaca mulatta]MPN83322.1 immunoglobulin heavy chain junction region [Macaca mulatta]MPN83358.1 immunoglobulin heavy chain junction region [Macaca mulatta]MPN83361.1 immunoglobulin heavy chain junction region [Macaca mulatta]
CARDLQLWSGYYTPSEFW